MAEALSSGTQTPSTQTPGTSKPRALLLIDREGGQHLIDPTRDRQELPGVGRFSTTLLKGLGPGDTVKLGGRVFTILAPSLSDTLEGLKRGPQWVGLKDGAWLLAACGIGAGDLVAEAGSGTGALTVQLAHAVAPGGRVISMDNRPEHQKVARANVARAGFQDLVEFHQGDVAGGIPGPENIDPFMGYRAILLDLPEPWTALEAVSATLVVGGWLAAYLPTTNQLDRLVSALDDFEAAGDGPGWTGPQVVENLQREWQTRQGALRPKTRMLGHTGFCITVRWLGPKMY